MSFDPLITATMSACFTSRSPGGAGFWMAPSRVWSSPDVRAYESSNPSLGFAK
jgi:hypothetical protein